MEAAATLTLSSTIQINPFRVFTCTGHKPTITINPRNRTLTLFPHGHLHEIMCGHKSSHVVHAVRAGEMKGEDYGNRARRVVGPTVVLACVLGTMCLTLPMSRPSLANAAEVTCAKNVPTIEALMNMHEIIAMEKGVTNRTTKEAEILLDNATRITRPIDPADLKEAARKLVLSGKIDRAVEKLEKKYYKSSLIRNGRSDQETYYYGLVLVEMLIYQRMYHKAKTLVEELEKAFPRDPDPKLYKAVIYLMLGDDKVAKEAWAEYKDRYIPLPPQDETSQSDDIPFDAFKGKIIKAEGRR